VNLVTSAQSGPVIGKDRIVSLDVLRGLAVLGILMINIQCFALIGTAFRNPHACGMIKGPDYWTWLVSQVLFQGRFMSIFSMLFGAGIILMATRRRAAGLGCAGIHYRRMCLLLLIGICHAYLIWYGDILYSYALAGMVVFLLRKLRPSVQIVLAVLLLSVPALQDLHAGRNIKEMPIQELYHRIVGWTPTQAAIEKETSTYLGSWMEQRKAMIPTTFKFHLSHFPKRVVWFACGFMLMGMALFKLGVFSARRSKRFYAGMIMAALLIGLPVSIYGAYRNHMEDWAFTYSRYLGPLYNYIAVLPVAFGWIGLIMLICKSGRITWLIKALSAVGRIALTNYLLATVICTFLFYGHGLGLHGQLSRFELLGVVLGVWIVQIIVSRVWLRFFRFGPLEWLWRSATYGKIQGPKKALAGLGVGLGMIVLLSACSGESARFSGRNVLLISIDTCRIDHLEPYGSDKVKTPNISAIAREGVLFLDAVTPAPLTTPAHITLLTGLHPARHGVRDNLNMALSDDAETLGELFKGAGYTTAGVIGVVLLSRRSGMGQGFDHYEDVFTKENPRDIRPYERKADEVVDGAVNLLREHLEAESPEPFFLFLHFYDPHTKYDPPKPFSELYSDNKYGGEIAYVDDCIGRLFGFLKDKQLYEEMLIVLVGDHGEGLGDHGEKAHGLFLYEECVRVPMIIRLPRSDPGRAGARVAQSAGLQDVMPTLAELFGIKRVDTDGISLVPWLFNDAKQKERWTALETHDPLTYGWSPLYALRNREWKYVFAPESELYNLATDPGEADNLYHDLPDRAGQMHKELKARQSSLERSSSFGPGEGVAADRIGALAALGYAGGGDSKKPGANVKLPDPKNKIEVYDLIYNGFDALTSDRASEAVPFFKDAAKKDPENPWAFYSLSLAYMRLNDADRAMQHAKKAVRLAPDNVLILLQMSKILITVADYAKAGDILRSLLKSNHKLARAHFLLGWADMKQKRHDTALKHFQEAKRWMPDMPRLDDAITSCARKAGK